MGSTLKGQLKYGLIYEGKAHTDFEIRLPLVKDTLAVLSKYKNIDAADLPEGDKDFAVSVEIMMRCLLSLGSIPKEVLTYEYLLNGMVDEDFDVFSAAFNELKKKRQDAVLASNITKQLD